MGYSKSSLTSVGEQPLVEDPYEKRTCQVRMEYSFRYYFCAENTGMIGNCVLSPMV